MVMKVVYAQIVAGNLILPPEALAALPEGVKLYTLIDSEKGTVTIHANNPSVFPNRDILDKFGELTQDENWETYTEPVPEESLRRPRKPEHGDNE